MSEAGAAETASDFETDVEAAFAIIVGEEETIARGVRDSDINVIRLGHKILGDLYDASPDAYYKAYNRFNGRE